MGRNERTHTADLLFTIGLFCVFTAAALMLMMIGVQAYRSTAANMRDTFSTRTAISYVAEKIRRCDAAGALALGDVEGRPALVLSEELAGSLYHTYIYADGEDLCELTVQADAAVRADMGEHILQVRDFAIDDAGNGFYAFSASDSGGRTLRYLIHPRSGG